MRRGHMWLDGTAQPGPVEGAEAVLRRGCSDWWLTAMMPHARGLTPTSAHTPLPGSCTKVPGVGWNDVPPWLLLVVLLALLLGPPASAARTIACREWREGLGHEKQHPSLGHPTPAQASPCIAHQLHMLQARELVPFTPVPRGGTCCSPLPLPVTAPPHPQGGRGPGQRPGSPAACPLSACPSCQTRPCQPEGVHGGGGREE